MPGGPLDHCYRLLHRDAGFASRRATAVVGTVERQEQFERGHGEEREQGQDVADDDDADGGALRHWTADYSNITSSVAEWPCGLINLAHAD